MVLAVAAERTNYDFASEKDAKHFNVPCSVKLSALVSDDLTDDKNSKARKVPRAVEVRVG